MSRPGITFQDVANAAQLLTSQGRNPTIENVRSITGTGSSTTIAQHLKAWKTKQDHTRDLCDKEKLPEEIILTVKGLWERVVDQAEDRAAVIKQELDVVITELKERSQKLQEDNNRWQQQYQILKKEKEILFSDKAALEHIVRQLEDEKITFNLANENLKQQLHDKQESLEELQRLNRQVQANLEHYREAAREQRLIDQQRYDQLQVQQEHIIHKLKQDITIKDQQNSLLKTEYEQLNYAENILRKEHDNLIEKHQKLSENLNTAQKQLLIHAHSEQHWQQQYHDATIKIEEQQKAHMMLGSQVAVLNQKLSDANQHLNQLQDQNKFLSQERWLLSQEKAQLLGQLKQLEIESNLTD